MDNHLLCIAPRLPIDEGLAAHIVEQLEDFRAHMDGEARAISDEAHAALMRDWPSLLDQVLFRETRAACFLLRCALPVNLN